LVICLWEVHIVRVPFIGSNPGGVLSTVISVKTKRWEPMGAFSKATVTRFNIVTMHNEKTDLTELEDRVLFLPVFFFYVFFAIVIATLHLNHVTINRGHANINALFTRGIRGMPGGTRDC